MALRVFLALAVLSGVGAWYGEPYVGGDLFCGGKYALDTGPWVAIDVERYQDGWWQCGDWLLIRFPDGTILRARALDAGPFSAYWIEQYGPDVPIVVDVPEHEWPLHPALSSPVTVINVSLLGRFMSGGQISGGVGGF